MLKQKAELEVGEIASTLSNLRRRAVIDCLSERQKVSMGELADCVVRAEFGGDYSSSQRKSVYMSLKQNHLPPMIRKSVVKESAGLYMEGPRFDTFEEKLALLRD